MFKFLLKHSKSGSRSSRKKAKPVHAAPPSTKAETFIFDRSHSIELENGYYCHITGNESLTNNNLNSAESDFIQSIRELINSSDYLEDEIPRLPNLLPKLLKMLRSDDASWKSVVDVITQDPVLVAGIVKVANSSFYRLSTKAENLEQVVVHLGQKGVREAVTSVALKPIMQIKGGGNFQNCSKRIWDHSVKSAIASRAVADSFQVNSYDAYLAGLVHNVGMIIILKKLALTSELNDIPCSLQFKEQITKLSNQLSSKILECWNMPQVTVDAVNDQLGLSEVESYSKLGTALFCGKSISAHHTLMNSTNWNNQFSSSDALQNLSNHEPFKQAYTDLNQIEQ